MKTLQFLTRLLGLLSAVTCQMMPEDRPRPTIEGYTTMKGYCDTPFGTIPSENYSGKDGILKACAKRCSQLTVCKGFNMAIDTNQCQLFYKECSKAHVSGILASIFLLSKKPKQNFYLKGVINCATSTVGEEFYMAFMSNRAAKPSENQSLEIWLAQDLNDKGSTVVLETDTSVTNVSKKINLPPKHSVLTEVPSSLKMKDLDQGVSIERKGIRLYSDDPFVAYGVNKEFSTTDAFMAIPSRLLGMKYMAVCHWPPFYNCEFAITAVEDDTAVSITLPKSSAENIRYPNMPFGVSKCALPYNGHTYSNGDTFMMTLSRFQVLQVQDLCDLTGTIIEADNQIAVWSGNSRVNVGASQSRDHLVEQLFSVDTWGTDCAAWPTPNREPELVDTWVITAAVDNTLIRVESTHVEKKMYTLNAGESVRFQAADVNEWMHFTSDKKFQAVQFSHSAVNETIPGDPSMTICIPSSDFGYGYTFSTPVGVSSKYDDYLTIVTLAGSEKGFLLDGNDITADVVWTKLPNSTLVGGYFGLPSDQHQFHIENRAKGTAFEAYIYGAGERESYAYPTGACIKATGECHSSRMNVADGKDNDCDGVVDEELCDSIDNDYDGKIDEDCYETGTSQKTKATTSQPGAKVSRIIAGIQVRSWHEVYDSGDVTLTSRSWHEVYDSGDTKVTKRPTAPFYPSRPCSSQTNGPCQNIAPEVETAQPPTYNSRPCNSQASESEPRPCPTYARETETEPPAIYTTRLCGSQTSDSLVRPCPNRAVEVETEPAPTSSSRPCSSQTSGPEVRPCPNSAAVRKITPESEKEPPREVDTVTIPNYTTNPCNSQASNPSAHPCPNNAPAEVETVTAAAYISRPCNSQASIEPSARPCPNMATEIRIAPQSETEPPREVNTAPIPDYTTKPCNSHASELSSARPCPNSGAEVKIAAEAETRTTSIPNYATRPCIISQTNGSQSGPCSINAEEKTLGAAPQTETEPPLTSTSRLDNSQISGASTQPYKNSVTEKIIEIALPLIFTTGGPCSGQSKPCNIRNFKFLNDDGRMYEEDEAQTTPKAS